MNCFASLADDDVDEAEWEADGIPLMSFDEWRPAQEENKRARKKKGKKEAEENLQVGLHALFSLGPEVLGFEGQEQWKTLEVVMDSGAAESVAPERSAPWVQTKPSRGSTRGQIYTSASGEKLPNKGEKNLELMTDEGEWARATFQIAEVTRPLCSVSRVCDRGNKVVFGAGGGYVEHLASGKRSYFQRSHNVYVMNMHVLMGSDGHDTSEGFARQGPRTQRGQSSGSS